MTQRELAAEQLGHEVREAARATARNPWVRGVARLGFVAIGLVYILTGVLAVRLALGIEQVAPDKEAALLEILAAPFGRGLLAVVAVGLLGYALWRGIEALLDASDKGADLAGLSARAGYLISAIFYSGLSVQAARMALGRWRDSGDDPSQTWTARLLGQPFGMWLVIALGVGVIAVGISQLIYAWQAGFHEHLALDKLSAEERRWATLAGRVGYGARGFVLGLAGAFFIRAALSFDPSQARGLGGSLAELAVGDAAWLLGAVALGLAAYGIFALVLAKYHRVLCR